ncbi:hypothetical protein E2542_SST05206 [Spatholobus suberectus]|nr:hypothetical protein E2542_SST05206 [Spatholobus suberectus]
MVLYFYIFSSESVIFYFLSHFQQCLFRKDSLKVLIGNLNFLQALKLIHRTRRLSFACDPFLLHIQVQCHIVSK